MIGLVAEIEGVIDIAEVFGEDLGLGAGIADVGMAVLDQIDRPRPHRFLHEGAGEGAAVDFHAHRAGGLLMDGGIKERAAVAPEKQEQLVVGLAFSPDDSLPLVAEIEQLDCDRLGSVAHQHPGREEKEFLPDRAGEGHHPAAAAGGGAGDAQPEGLAILQAGRGQIEGHQSETIPVPVAADGAKGKDRPSSALDLPLRLVLCGEFGEGTICKCEGEGVLAQVAAQAREPDQAHPPRSRRQNEGLTPPGHGGGAVTGAADQGLAQPGEGGFIAHGRAAQGFRIAADDDVRGTRLGHG